MAIEGVWIAIVANLCFVSSNVIFRRSDKEASPAFINLIRTFIGVISFILFALIEGILPLIFQIPINLWLWLILSFVFGQVLGDTAYFISQKNLGTTQALAISMTFPVFTYIFSILFLNDPFELTIIFSFISILAGVMLINRGQIGPHPLSTPITDGTLQVEQLKKDHFQNSQQRAKILAIFFGLLAALGWAAGLVIIDYATNQIEGLGISNSSILGNVIRFPFAFIILIGVSFSFDKTISFKKSTTTWLWLILGSIIGTSLGAYFYTEAARVAGATVMSLIASASPVFALPISYIINREKITIISFFGVCLTIFGVILILL